MNSMMRRPVKDTADNQRRWRDKFKQECTDRMKNARRDKMNKVREEQWMQKTLKDDWAPFIKENEKAMKEEGITDIDLLIEESIQEYEEEENEFYLQREQEELESAIALYESMSLCVNCHAAPLEHTSLNNTPIVKCPQCGFYATEPCLQQVQHAASVHSETCPGKLEYALEPGINNTLLSVCDTCDLFNMFNM